MIYATYNLSTLKNHAKQLKRLAKTHEKHLTTMRCLDMVAMSHNASSWNALYLAHTRALENLKACRSHDEIETELIFVEDLDFTNRLECFNNVMSKLSQSGLPKHLLNEYKQKISALYEPNFSEFYRRKSDKEFGAPPRYTSLPDMYGSLLVASAEMSRHTRFLIDEVIPYSLKHGGTLFITESQYQGCEELLKDDRINILFIGGNREPTPLAWCDNNNGAALQDFFSTGVTGYSGEMQEALAVNYTYAFFDLWVAVGVSRFPVSEVGYCSPETMTIFLDSLGRTHPAAVRARKTLFYMGVDASVDGWAKKISPVQQEFFDYAAIVHNSMLSSFKQRTSGSSRIEINTLFEDLSRITVVVCSAPSSNDASLSLAAEVSIAIGVLNLLRCKLLETRIDAIVHGKSRTKHMIYTSPNNHTVQKGHHLLLSSPLYATAKTIVSVLADQESGSESLLAETMHYRRKKNAFFDSVEYNSINHAVTHKVDLRSLESI